MPGRPRLGEPYLVHPRSRQRAGRHEDGFRFDCRGLLHDSVEDTSVTTVEIKQDSASRLRTSSKASRRSAKSISHRRRSAGRELRKMMLAMVDDIRVVLIKLADRLHNMRTLEHLDPERQQKIAARRSKSTRPSRTVWHGQDSRRTGGSGV